MKATNDAHGIVGLVDQVATVVNEIPAEKTVRFFGSFPNNLEQRARGAHAFQILRLAWQIFFGREMHRIAQRALFAVLKRDDLERERVQVERCEVVNSNRQVRSVVNTLAIC